MLLSWTTTFHPIHNPNILFIYKLVNRLNEKITFTKI